MRNPLKKSLLLAAAMTALISSAAQADIINLAATDDSWVYNQAPTVNNGTAANVETYWYKSSPLSTTTQEYWTYLKFDLSAIPANQGVTSVTLNMYNVFGSTYTSPNYNGVRAYYVANDTWNESTLNWNNKSAFNVATDLVGQNYSISFGSTVAPRLHQWVLTLTPQMLADGVLSIALLEAPVNPSTLKAASHKYASKEFVLAADGSTNWDPYLSVNYTPAPVPIPAAAWLLGTGLLGLVGVRRRMRK